MHLAVTGSFNTAPNITTVRPHDDCASCPTRPWCLARNLDGTQLTRLAAQLAPPMMLHRGDYLYRAGDTTDAVHIVRSGAVKTLILTSTGDELVAALHFAGELFGLAGFTQGIHADTAMALDTSSVCRVRLADLPGLWSLGCDRAFLHLIGEKESAGLRTRIRLAESGAASRLAAYLLERSGAQQKMGLDSWSIYLPVTRTDLANYLGMTLESLSRTMSRLARAGIIQADKSRIHILRLPELQTLCDTGA
jgi:CRP/FNR family transcriptional regulator, anaerobic regulatory protein